MCLSSLYLYSQKSFIIWEDSVRVDMLLKPAETDRNRGVKRERREKHQKSERRRRDELLQLLFDSTKKSDTYTLVLDLSGQGVCVCACMRERGGGV